MLPYLAQGANSAIEDGAVLGLLLGRIQSRDDVPQALRMYENLRKARGESIVQETFKQVSNQALHVADVSRADLITARIIPYARRSRTRGSRQCVPVTARQRAKRSFPKSMDVPAGPAVVIWI